MFHQPQYLHHTAYPVNQQALAHANSHAPFEGLMILNLNPHSQAVHHVNQFGLSHANTHAAFEGLQELNFDDEDLMELRLLSDARRAQIKSNFVSTVKTAGSIAAKAAPVLAAFA